MPPRESDDPLAHRIAQELSFMHNRDWRYDPGNPRHRHWYDKGRFLLEVIRRYESTSPSR